MAEKEKSVYEILTDWVTDLKKSKKKNITKQEIIDKIDSAFQNKQTVEVNILIEAPTKFEGLNKDQVSVFLKIFDGYKADLESKSSMGKATILKGTPPLDTFEEVKGDSKKQSPRSTPPIV